LHNFVPNDGFSPKSRAGAGEFALAAGRLTEEKGFDTAIAAARAADVPLVIAGEGPDEERLRGLAAGADVRFTGLLAPSELAELRTRAAVLLAPSRWEEPCPYSVLEALAAGVPVLAADRGGLPELVGDDATLPATDRGAWSDALSELWQNPRLRADVGAAALARAHERFGEDRFYNRLMQLYGAVSA
jgi:glycosyltransferase involved in cell wall biosynthesis